MEIRGPSALIRGKVLLQLLVFGWSGCRRSLAHDLDHGFLIFGAVVVYLLCKVLHEASRGHGNRALGVVFATGAYPPCSGEDGDEAVVGMKVRVAHAVGRPFYQHNVGSRLAR